MDKSPLLLLNLTGSRTLAVVASRHNLLQPPVANQPNDCNVYHVPPKVVLSASKKSKLNTSKMPTNSISGFAAIGSTKCDATVIPDDVRPVSHIQPENGPTTIDLQCDAELQCSRRSYKATLVDQMYNDRNLRNEELEAGGRVMEDQPESEKDIQVQRPHVPSPLTTVDLQYYYILCGMGRSKWKDYVAVRFSTTTTVSWEFFGQSIEPEGHCHDFFIAGFCRKNFEDCHPRISKKHFFYPKVGHSMMEYKSQNEIQDLRKYFLGANSALKLHRADKLYFPVCHLNHWFVFIVDLKNRCFVFLDSLFGPSDSFQCLVRDKIIQVFNVLWLLYAESKMDLSSFRIVYPPVPKQGNTHDCGIFMLKNMELFDMSVDLKLKFSQEHVPQMRISLANELYFSDKNQEDKSLIHTFFKQKIDPRAMK